MTLIKICGIMDPETAFFAAQAGADFIGIIQDPRSKRYVPLPLALEIARAARLGGAKPVAVYVDAASEEIMKGCSDIVQLHGGDRKLPENFSKIYVNDPSAILRKDRDCLLFDNVKPGSGAKFDWESFEPPVDKPWFLAGGLNPNNVAEAIKKLHPTGVDVSTGVEVNGIKDKKLILEFIQKVREHE